MNDFTVLSGSRSIKRYMPSSLNLVKIDYLKICKVYKIMNSLSENFKKLLLIAFILFIPHQIYGGEKNFRQLQGKTTLLCKADIASCLPAPNDMPAHATTKKAEPAKKTERVSRKKAERPAKKPARVRVRKAERLLHPVIVKAADRHKIEPAIIKAIIKAESGYNSRAVSKKGARGLMQLMPRTAKWLGVKDSFDPEQNINGGTKYFKQLLKEFDGELKLALAAYNSGSQKVKKYRGVPPFKATKRYIKNVLKYYQQYKYQGS
ncbi:MAG: lytic transglycosylase domain-containing protein [Desulfobacteraceae bacterium]|nr:lytic transglycosylase domain-containing protein [Desulfobacteraceae bacterium]